MSNITLFCFPFAGGSSYSYQGFAPHKPDFVDLVPLELPGRGRRIRENLLRNIDAMVDDLYNQVVGKIKGRYAFYGHSMGTLLSFRLAQRLVEKGYAPPVHLFVSGRGGPSVDRDDLVKRSQLPRPAFIEKVRELDGSPDEVLNDDDLMNLFVPVLRADFEAIEKYVYQPSNLLSVPIDVIIGSEEKISAEEAWAWQYETNAPVAVHHLPGKHFFILKHPKEIMRLIGRKVYQETQLHAFAY